MSEALPEAEAPLEAAQMPQQGAEAQLTLLLEPAMVCLLGVARLASHQAEAHWAALTAALRRAGAARREVPQWRQAAAVAQAAARCRALAGATTVMQQPSVWGAARHLAHPAVARQL